MVADVARAASSLPTSLSIVGGFSRLELRVSVGDVQASQDEVFDLYEPDYCAKSDV